MWPFDSPFPNLTPAEVGTPLAKVKDVTAEIQTTYDYIIVGGGTAGCCLASRLTEQPGTTVLLLERGAVTDTWLNQIPLVSSELFKVDGLARDSRSAPLAHAGGHTVTMFRGEALGGGSRINGMILTRGTPAEYNKWRDMGNAGWGYEDLKPCFARTENTLTHPRSDYRGKEGGFVNQTFTEYPFRVLQCFETAANNLGIPSVPDFNSPTVPSVSCASLDIGIDQNMHRVSSYSTFLPPKLANSRKEYLKVCAETLAKRIVFDQGDGGPPRAIGVEFIQCRRDDVVGGTYFAKARKEVVVCCGAIGTPQLLMLSGVGPASHLKEHGIQVVFDSPGVGQHLKDHVNVPVIWKVPRITSRPA